MCLSRGLSKCGAKLLEIADIFRRFPSSNQCTFRSPRAEEIQGEDVGKGTGILVIGGGPAGLAAAIAARMKGFAVAHVDGAKPPIDKACGEGLMPGTMAALRQLGVAICPDNGQVFRGVRFIDSATSVEADFSHARGFGVRRTVLHQKMVERAQECGVTLLWNTPVTGLCGDGPMGVDSVRRAE